jgi:transposase
MAQSTPSERRAWFRWHVAHGENVAATCRHFGIARSTFYRWQRRFSPAHPRQSLRRARPAQAVRRPRPKEALFFKNVVELQRAHPRWGRGRLRQALVALRDDAPSEATIGRWLRAIVYRCPVCGGTEGRHDGLGHAQQEAFEQLELGDRIRLSRRSRRARGAAGQPS